jgi:two-component system, OmpR family, response regulator VicR
MSDPQVQLLDTQQVAQYCGVPLAAVMGWLQKGRLDAELRGAEYLIKVNDLVNFMHQNHLVIPAELIRAMGLDVVLANNGFDASVNYIKRKPQLMTLDLNLEGMSGIELIKNIRATQSHKSKILVITDSMPSLIAKARTAGADAILNKPFDNDALRRNVRILLGLD